MYRYVTFLDDVLDEIEERVAAFPPERGGALLGPIGQPLVTEFVYDQQARTSGVTYRPSRWLQAQVQAREGTDPQIELKGILHSHPGDMAWPSEGDHYAYQDSLRGAPWLGRLITPIVTAGRRRTRPHEVALPSGILSVFITERRHANEHVVVQEAATHVLPFSRDLAALANELNGAVGRPGSVDIDGQLYIVGVVGFDGFDLQVLLGPAYPFTPPIVIAARRNDANGGALSEPRLGLHWDDDSHSVQGVPLAWDLTVPDESRLISALVRQELPKPEPATEAVPTTAAVPDGTDQHIAENTG